MSDGPSSPVPSMPPVSRPGMVPLTGDEAPQMMPLAGLTTLPDGRKAGFLVFQFRAFYAEVRALAEEARLSGAKTGDGLTFNGLVRDIADGAGHVPPMAPPPPPSLGVAPFASPPPPPPPPFAADPITAPPAPPAFLGGKPVDLVETMIRQLSQRLEEGSAEAARLGGAYGAAIYREAKYVMAALADETFLHEVEWEGQLVWRDTLVETRLFGSSIAGERVFQQIDALLDGGDPIHIELASVYLLALTLGFKGRFRGDNGLALEEYRRRLRDFIGRRLPSVIASEPVFAGSYAHTLDEGREQFLPAIQPWIWAILIFVCGYLIVSHGLWVWLTAPVRAIIGEG